MSYNPPGGYGYPNYQRPNPGAAPGIGFQGINAQPAPGAPYPYPVPGQPQTTPYPMAPSGMPTASPSFGAPQVPAYGQPQGYGQPSYGGPPMPGAGSPYAAGMPAAPRPSLNQTHTSTLPVPTNPGLQRKFTLPPQRVAVQGTVVDHPNFNAQQDAEILRKAMKGLGCDAKAVTHIITSRSNKQRQRIKLEFKTLYGKDLIKELKSELSGNHEDAALALMTTPEDFDAYHLRKAMKGVGTDEAVLIEILSSRTNQQIKKASAAFTALCGKALEDEIRSETSGHFKRLMIALCQGSRNEEDYVDAEKAKLDAKALYDAGEARWGTDESRFNVILADRSFPQLRATFSEYSTLCKYSIEASIEREMSGDLKNGMLAVVKCVKNTPAYFAEKLHKSMKGLGTDDDTLIRVIVSRSEIDMVQIRNEFREMYGKTLGRFIADDTSGNYRKLLLDIVGES